MTVCFIIMELHNQSDFAIDHLFFFSACLKINLQVVSSTSQKRRAVRGVNFYSLCLNFLVLKLIKTCPNSIRVKCFKDLIHKTCWNSTTVEGVRYISIFSTHKNDKLLWHTNGKLLWHTNAWYSFNIDIRPIIKLCCHSKLNKAWIFFESCQVFKYVLKNFQSFQVTLIWFVSIFSQNKVSQH